MFYFLIDLIPLNNTMVVIKEDNKALTCEVVEKTTDHRFGSNKFGDVNKTAHKLYCY